jgi:hypothetical protein
MGNRRQLHILGLEPNDLKYSNAGPRLQWWYSRNGEDFKSKVGTGAGLGTDFFTVVVMLGGGVVGCGQRGEGGCVCRSLMRES